MTFSRLVPSRTVLLVVDVQERLAAAMPEDVQRRLVANALVLLEAARVLGVRAVLSEQYPKGLGPTVTELADKAREVGATILPKSTFDALADAHLRAEILGTGERPEDVVVLGMESHVCVYQTVRALEVAGVRAHVVSDAVASRTEANRTLGLAMAERLGARVTGTETVLFDWLERAGTDAFKQLSRLIR